MFRLPRLPRVLLLLCIALLAGCMRLDPPGPGQPLVVGLPEDPVFHQQAPPTEGMEGFSRDLAGLFAAGLGVEVRYVTAPDYPTQLAMVRAGKVHFAAAVPALRGDPVLRYTPPLHESRQVVVQNSGALPVETIADLAGREIAVMPGAPQATALRSLKLDPPPIIVEGRESNEIELLASVERRRQALAASDELHFTIAANFHPDLDIAVELPEKLAYVWAFHADQQTLRDRAADFIDAAKQDGTLRRLNDRYFGHIRRLDTRDIQTFLEHMRSRLPDFRHVFQEAQEITGIDWRLLAALAYQESKWDPLATSPTGVRGMMMLTEDTADRLRVTNRLDARQSILAGAKYLLILMDELAEAVGQPDRLWFALAAYNLGMGHLNGARHFAPSLKRDANLWVDMKQVLPLMARPEYYTRLKSGRARGGEAVILVENVRNYFDVLSRFEPAYTTPRLGGTAKHKQARQAKKPVKKPVAVKPQRNGLKASSPPR
jgi:membrane-bound lytic murein transglycosylase F